MADHYLTICEQLYANWLRGARQLGPEARRVLSDEHAPEPYLMFGRSTSPLVFLSTNPGVGFDFQLHPDRAASSLFAGVTTYDKAALKLGDFYSAPGAPINATSRSNIASMLRIAGLGGRTGVLQAEALPWHSASLPNKGSFLSELARRESSYKAYREALSTYLNDEPIVFAWAAGSPSSKGGSGVELKAALIGLALQRAELLPLERTSVVSQGLLWTRQAGRFRGLFVNQGSATLPATGRNRAGQDKDRLIASLL